MDIPELVIDIGLPSFASGKWKGLPVGLAEKLEGLVQTHSSSSAAQVRKEAVGRLPKWNKDRRREGATEFPENKLPQEKTFERHVKEFRHYKERFSGELWSPADGSLTPEDSRYVADVMAVGSDLRFKRAEATHIAKFRVIAPGLDSFRAYLLATLYRIRFEKSADTADLDQYLAYKPWESNDSLDRYVSLCERSKVPLVPMADTFLDRRLFAPMYAPSITLPGDSEQEETGDGKTSE